MLEEPLVAPQAELESYYKDFDVDFRQYTCEALKASTKIDAGVRLANGASVIPKVYLSTPAFLLFSDSFYPGWQALDNGMPTKIDMADRLLRAVFLQEGTHDVSFEYKPSLLGCAGKQGGTFAYSHCDGRSSS